MTIYTKRLRELAETLGNINGLAEENDAAEFIAATDPQTVLALLDEIERLHARVDSMQMANDMLRATHRTDNQYLLDEIERLRQWKAEAMDVLSEWKWEQPECDWETRTHSINCDCWGPLEQKVRRRVGPWEPVEGDHR